MYSIISYVRFLLKATNQHGVHSPFIYSFVTKGLYTKEKLSPTKHIDIFLKALEYFSVKTLKIDSNCRLYQNNIKTGFPHIKTTAKEFDAIYLTNISHWNKTILKGQIQNNSWVFIPKIHTDKSTTIQWQKIKEAPEVTVSIDLFYGGIIFFRREQEKEHFKIRY